MKDTDRFNKWLLEELEKRSWRPADLAHKAGLGSGTLSHILNGNRKPGPDFCMAIAKALGEPPEKVFRFAGLLPYLPGGENDPLVKELSELIRNLTPEMREEAARYLRYLYQQQQAQKKKK